MVRTERRLSKAVAVNTYIQRYTQFYDENDDSLPPTAPKRRSAEEGQSGEAM